MKPTLEQDKLIYLQIAQGIEDEILKGILGEGDQVLSTNQLARRYQINPATAAKGINLLVDQGILFKKRGLGMFVAEGAKVTIQQSRRKNFFREYVHSLLQEAEKLDIGVEEIIVMIQKRGEAQS